MIGTPNRRGVAFRVVCSHVLSTPGIVADMTFGKARRPGRRVVRIFVLKGPKCIGSDSQNGRRIERACTGTANTLGRRVFPNAIPGKGSQRRHACELQRGIQRPSDWALQSPFTSYLSLSPRSALHQSPIANHQSPLTSAPPFTSHLSPSAKRPPLITNH